MLPLAIAFVLLVALAATVRPARAAPSDVPTFAGESARIEDFRAFCTFVADTYAYADVKATDWDRVCAAYAPRAAAAGDRNSFVAALEEALGQLYDAHAHLGTNTAHSPRLVPSGASVQGHWQDGSAVVAAVRAGSAAEQAGVHAGQQIVSINEMPIAEATQARMPRFLRHDDPAAREWALQVALAANHDQPILRLTVRDGARLRELRYAVPEGTDDPGLLAASLQGDGVGVIRLHNSLGQSTLVAAFDAALAQLGAARALVIDLRDTPSGGTTTVARGILGRFARTVAPYQRHERIDELRASGVRRIWVEYVAPRGVRFAGPVVVLVGPWTGSMGEGLAVGLDAVAGAVVMGRPMAHLLGALDETQLPNTRITVRVPAEKLFHVNGTPREDFAPQAIPPALPATPGQDAELAYAVDQAARQAARAYTAPANQPEVAR